MSAMRSQHGFTLATAVFLLVVLGALGAFILTVSTAQHRGAALDIQGARAYQAARAGIEWGLYRSLRDNACASGAVTFAGTTLEGFTANVACTAYSADEAGTTVTIHRIVATACNQPPCPSAAPGEQYVERQLSATVER
jgi:MSHA biogenesis protein MshP